MILHRLRQEYHAAICHEIIRTTKGFPNFADGNNRSSKEIAWGIIQRMGFEPGTDEVKEQTAGGRFESITARFLQSAFEYLSHLRPGKWYYSTVQTDIACFDQYQHLAYLANAITKDRDLASAFGGDYIVKPDIVIGKWPATDDEINQFSEVIEPEGPIAKLTSFRQANREKPVMSLHASISCKWTIRSDRSQNTRTEALNLIRNRKGPLPHIAAVTAEPLPTRIATLALGTGDLDCVYHFALNELAGAIEDCGNIDQLDILKIMVEGRRLRDISDLPFDLAI
jgi:hypothetical protein